MAPRAVCERHCSLIMISKIIVIYLCLYSDYFGFTTTLKHSVDSQTDAKGVHVTWMLAPFIKYRNLVSYPQGPSPPRVVHKDDSITLKVL